VITLRGVMKVNHAGYRCPNGECPGHQRIYRSVEADALALPRMTYGLDIVLLVGDLHLKDHPTVDEIHREVLKHLEPLGVKIARREILSLFEASCTLLRAASLAKDDQAWLGQVKKNGGIIVSVDGIQPEKGNETVAPFARCPHGTSVGSRERDVVRNGGHQGVAQAGSGIGRKDPGYDHRCDIRANCWPSSNCGPMFPTRCASSTSCAMPPNQLLRRIGK